MTEKELPLVEYKLDVMFAIKQTCEAVAPDSTNPEGAEDRAASFSWDWYPVERRERSFAVILGISIKPSKTIAEQIAVKVLAGFTLDVPVPEVPLDVFVYREAPALIFPFIQDIVLSLTSRGLYQTYKMPQVDISQVLREFSFDTSRAGKMLRQQPRLAAAFGLTVPAKPGRRPRTKKPKQAEPGSGKS